MNNKSVLKYFAILFLFAAPLFADDEVILTNGRRMTGSIQNMTEQFIYFQIADTGEIVQIPRSGVSGGSFGSIQIVGNEESADRVQDLSPLLSLDFNSSLTNSGKLSATINSHGYISYGDDLRGRASSSIISNGNGNYLDINTSGFLNSLTEFTVSFWFNILDNFKTQYLVSKWEESYGDAGNADGVFAIAYTQDGNILVFLVDEDGKYYAYQAIKVLKNKNSWNHLAVSYANQKLMIYINGDLVFNGDTPIDLLFQKNTSPLRLLTARNTSEGDDNFRTYNLQGLFDSFRFWNIALDANAIKQEYQNSTAN